MAVSTHPLCSQTGKMETGSLPHPQLVPDMLPPHQGVSGLQAGAPGFTFALRLVLVREVLRACACHQLHIGSTVDLGAGAREAPMLRKGPRVPPSGEGGHRPAEALAGLKAGSMGALG